MRQAKKISARPTRKRKPVQLATSSVLTDRRIATMSDEELAAKFAQPVARVRQARYAVGLFRWSTLTEKEEEHIKFLAAHGLSASAIARALGRTMPCVGVRFRNFGMPLHMGKVSKDQQERANELCRRRGLLDAY